MKLVDPVTLKVVAEAWFPERSSYPRMSMSRVKGPEGQDEDAIILLGDEHVFQFRWRPQTHTLYHIPEWTQRYRKRWDGTLAGTGPTIYDNKVFFTDNTYPRKIFLKKSIYA